MQQYTVYISVIPQMYHVMPLSHCAESTAERVRMYKVRNVVPFFFVLKVKCIKSFLKVQK